MAIVVTESKAGGSNDYKFTHGMPEMKLSWLCETFNVNRLMDIYNSPEPYISYIIMTRPDLNLFSNRVKRLSSMYTKLNQPANKIIVTGLTNLSKGKFLPLVTNRAKTYSVQDTDIKVIEKGGTFYGHTIKYGKHSEEYKKGGTFSIDFINDRFLDILVLMDTWRMYIKYVSRGAISPYEEYIRNAILDYTSSLFYLVVKRDGKELVYWEKLVGVFPIMVPYSIFSSSGNMILEDDFSIQFAYSMRDEPMDIEILSDINDLGIKSSYANTYNKIERGASNAFASAPRIVEGNGKYYLLWTEKAL